MRSLIFVFIVFVFSCSLNKKKLFTDYYIDSSKIKLLKHHSTNENTSGELKVLDLNVTYNEGKNVYQGPEDELEYFMKTFRQTYYLKYFDTLYIDKKTQKLYRDSVQLLDYRRIKQGEEASCKACNVMAVMKFRNMIKPFYTFYTNELIEELQKAKIERDTIKEFIYKTYESKDETGALIYSINRDSELNQLSLTLNKGNKEAFKKFIKTIKPNQR